MGDSVKTTDTSYILEFPPLIRVGKTLQIYERVPLKMANLFIL